MCVDACMGMTALQEFLQVCENMLCLNPCYSTNARLECQYMIDVSSTFKHPPPPLKAPELKLLADRTWLQMELPGTSALIDPVVTDLGTKARRLRKDDACKASEFGPLDQALVPYKPETL